MVHLHSAVPKISTFSIKKHNICSLYKAVCMVAIIWAATPPPPTTHSWGLKAPFV